MLKALNNYQVKKFMYRFFLLNYNIRSFSKNGIYFDALLESMHTLPDFIVITETWNSPNNVDNCTFLDYCGVHTYRESSRGGGISIFCQKNFLIEKLDQLSQCNHVCEICTAVVSKDSESIVIIGIYRPPDGSVEEFIHYLEDLILNPILRNKFIIITGDININLSDSENSTVQKYHCFLNSYHLLPVITVPTRFAPNNPSINPSTLDHIIINKSILFNSGVIEIDFTDHLPSFMQFNFFKNDNSKFFHKIQFRPFSDLNFQKLRNYLLNIEWSTVLNSTDVDMDTEIFMKIINEGYCKYFPVKTKMLSEKRMTKPWLSNDILKLVKEKANYFKYFKAGLLSKDVNNQVKNRVNCAIRKAKNDYYIYKFDAYKSDIKKSWKLIQDLIGRNRRPELIRQLCYNGTTTTDQLQMAEILNNYFTSIATELDEALPQPTVSPLNYVNPINQSSFHLYLSSKKEVENIISKLKIVRCEINQMPVNIFIKLKFILAQPLSRLINLSFISGKFPTTFKTARITPIFKKGSKESPNNYRPISSLPFVCKIFERCMVDRLISYFDSTSLLSEFQYGFQKGKSTADALVQLTENIYSSLNEKKHHVSVMIDLTKAFDTVNHEILLEKMELYGIRERGLNLFRNYLSNRKSFVRLGSKISSLKTTNVGVPQGSITGPILFLIYINDLPNISNVLKPLMFADDTTLSSSHKSLGPMVDCLNSELDKIMTWCVANKLTINPQKTEVIRFSNQICDRSESRVTLGGVEIEESVGCKFLGVHIDNKLNFKNHIQSISSKLTKNIGILYRIRDCLPLLARTNFYYAFIYPFLTYNIVIWGGTFENHLKPLNVLHKRAIRTICDGQKTDHTAPLFRKLNMLNLKDIYNFFMAIYMHKAVNNNEYVVTHQVNTRNRQMAVPLYHRLVVCQHAVSFSGPSVWNMIPPHIRSIESLPLFKRTLKQYYVEQYV